MEEKKPLLERQVAREDPGAVSAIAGLPAFIARPRDAPAYYGFPLLSDSEKDGFVFGVITSSRTDAPASWGDAYVVGPDGTRAGIVWRMKGPVTEVVFPPDAGRWGVYEFLLGNPMKKHYDFSAAKRNPYAKRLKQQLTIRLDTDTVAYFRTLAKETAIPYQTLMNLYLRDCAQERRRFRVAWPAGRAGRAKVSTHRTPG